MKEKFFKILNLYTLPLIVVAAGVITLLIGISNVNKSQTYSKTTAEIIKITSEYDAASESIHTNVFVRYTVDGREYDSELGSYRRSFREGMTIEIFYDPDNPVDVMATDGFSIYGIFGISALSLVLGASLLIHNVAKEVKYRREHEYDM